MIDSTYLKQNYVTDTSFSYQTQRKVKVSLVIKQINDLSQKKLLFYEKKKKMNNITLPGERVTFDALLTEGATNNQGQYTNTLTLGQHIDSLWVVIPALSYQKKITIVNNAINLTIKGA